MSRLSVSRGRGCLCRGQGLSVSGGKGCLNQDRGCPCQG